MSQELTALIDRLVTEKTFSVEGVKAIEELRKKAEGLEKTVEAMKDKNSGQAQELILASSTIERISKELSRYKEQDEALKKREAAIFEHEKMRAVAEAQSNAYKDALHTVFRPNTVRESVQKSTPIATQMQGGGSYVTHYTHSESSTREDG